MPGRLGEHGADRGLDAPVGVGDDEVDPKEPPGHERAQEGRPGLGVLGRDDVEPADLPPPLCVDRRGDDRRDVDHPTALAYPLGERVDPQVAIGTCLQRAVSELGHLAVELGSDAGHFGLRDPLDPHGLDQVVDPAGGHPFDVGLADDGQKRLLSTSAGVQQELGAVDALAELGDRKVDGADPGVPGTHPVAVAGVLPLVGPLCVAGVALQGRLGGHERLGERLQHRSGQVAIGVTSLEVLAKPGARVDSDRDSHRDPPQVVVRNCFLRLTR